MPEHDPHRRTPVRVLHVHGRSSARLTSLSRGVASLWLTASLFSAPSVSAVPAPNQEPACLTAAPDDPAPWVHNARILGAFPADAPPPRFVGRFLSAQRDSQIVLWKDARGLFGEWSSPVLDADSPTSRLYDVQFDASSGRVAFIGRFPSGERRFRGTLRGSRLRGTIQTERGAQSAVLHRVRREPFDQSVFDVKSRAQFECEMTLFRRY